MADFPALPLWTDAYMADTMHLTLEEHGAYLKLLMIAWRSTECSLPDNDKRIAQILSISERRWKEKLRPIIASFWTICDGKWTQKRLLHERKFQEKIRERNTAAANARWLKDKNSNDAGASSTHHPIEDTTSVPNMSQTDAPSPSPSPSPTKKKESALSGAKEKTRKTQIPDDWVLSPQQRQWAEDKAIIAGVTMIDWDQEADQFADHHRKVGSVFADWKAAWRTWARNAIKFKLEKSHGNRPHGNGDGRRSPHAALLEAGAWAARGVDSGTPGPTNTSAEDTKPGADGSKGIDGASSGVPKVSRTRPTT